MQSQIKFMELRYRIWNDITTIYTLVRRSTENDPLKFLIRLNNLMDCVTSVYFEPNQSFIIVTFNWTMHSHCISFHPQSVYCIVLYTHIHFAFQFDTVYQQIAANLLKLINWWAGYSIYVMSCNRLFNFKYRVLISWLFKKKHTEVACEWFACPFLQFANQHECAKPSIYSQQSPYNFIWLYFFLDLNTYRYSSMSLTSCGRN